VSRLQSPFCAKFSNPNQFAHSPDLPAGKPARQLQTRGNYLFICTAGGSGCIEQDEFRLVCQ